MKNRIIEIVELGEPQSIIHRENEPISELIKTIDLVEELNKQLLLHNVSQQRELLVAFAEWILSSEEDITSEMINKDVNTFLATNCG